MSAEYRRAVNHPTFGSLTIEVDKVGGGTVGKSYDGKWSVYITRFGNGVFAGDINTGRPATHWQVAELAIDFAHSEGRI